MPVDGFLLKQVSLLCLSVSPSVSLCLRLSVSISACLSLFPHGVYKPLWVHSIHVLEIPETKHVVP